LFFKNDGVFRWLREYAGIPNHLFGIGYQKAALCKKRRKYRSSFSTQPQIQLNIINVLDAAHARSDSTSTPFLWNK
jgi:hypothetical protein